MKAGLRPRVLAAVFLTAMLPLAIATSQGYHCAREAVLALVEGHLHSVLQSQVNLLQQWMTQREAELRALADGQLVSATLAEKPSPPVDELSISESDLLRSFESVSLLLSDGRKLPIYVSTTPRNRETANAVLVKLITEMKDENGTVMAQLQGEERLERELLPILRRSLDHTATIFLLPPGVEGMVTVGMRGASTVKREEVLQAVDEPVEQQDMSGHFVHGHREPKLLSATELGGSGWIVGAQLDPEEALHWLDVLIWRALWMSVLTLILVVIISLWISGTLTRPLGRMAEVADRIRSGDREAQFPPSKLREIQDVQNAVSQMLQELRLKERQLVQAGALAVVGELTSRVVHEMRNPLSSIKLNLQAFRRQAKEDEFTLELTQIALQQVDRLERMFTELLQYGRPIALQPTVTSFENLFTQSLQGVQKSAEEKEIQILPEDETLGASIEVDPEQMRRVLSNLMENAVQASPAESVVKVRAAVQRGASARLLITVEDEGPGFTEEAQRSLFKPFFTTKPGGVGLGLANVRKIVELHGGSISAASKPGGGAALTVHLPLRQPTPVTVSGNLASTML